MDMPEGTRLLILAPVIRGKKGEYRKELAEFQRRGFERVKINGTLMQIGDAPKLDKKLKQDIEVVVDRVVVREGLAQRLADSFETALSLADGIAYAENADTAERTVFSQKFACPVSGFSIEEIEPRLFSFNSPQGACPTCDGLGTESFFDPALVIPNPGLSLKQGHHRPLGRQCQHALFRPDAGLARRASEDRPDQALGRAAGGGPDRHPLRHRQGAGDAEV